MDTLGFQNSSILILQADMFSSTFFSSCKRAKVTANLDPVNSWLKDLYAGRFLEKEKTKFSYSSVYHMQWCLKTNENYKVTFEVNMSAPTADAISNSLNVISENRLREVGNYSGKKTTINICKDLVFSCEDITICCLGREMKTMADTSGLLTFSTHAQVANWSLNITPQSFIPPRVSVQPEVAPATASGTQSILPPNSLLRYNPAVPPPNRNRFSAIDEVAESRHTTGNGIGTFPKRKILPDQDSSSSSSRVSLGEKKKTTFGARTSTPRKKSMRGKDHIYDSISNSPELRVVSDDEFSKEDIHRFTEQFRSVLNVDSNDPLTEFLGKSLTSVLLHLHSKKASNLNDPMNEIRDTEHTRAMNALYDQTKEKILKQTSANQNEAPISPSLSIAACAPSDILVSQPTTTTAQPTQVSVTLNDSVQTILSLSEQQNQENNSVPEIPNSQIVTRSKSKQF